MEIRRSESAGDRMLSGGWGPMNILVAGIPVRPVLDRIRSRYPGDLYLYVAESRPYEMEVARAMTALLSSGIRASIVTDNMIGALLETVAIQAVWSQYLEVGRGVAVAINGAHMAALLARFHGIPCVLHPISGLLPGGSGRFAGEDITVPGAAYSAWEPDVVPLELVHEVIDRG